MGFETILIMLFLVKHLICDWWLQNSWMAFNKHKLFHPAGYVHAGINVFGTIFAVSIFVKVWGDEVRPDVAEYIFWLLIIGEFVLHFLMDYTKMNVNKWMEWSPTTHKQFWDLTGFDQFVHLSYLVFMGGMLV